MGLCPLTITLHVAAVQRQSGKPALTNPATNPHGRTAMKRKYATKEEMAARVEKARELAAQGMSQRTIATVLGVDQGNLSVLMRIHGIDAPRWRGMVDEREAVLDALAAGKTQAEAARIANVSEASAGRWARAAREAAQ